MAQAGVVTSGFSGWGFRVLGGCSTPCHAGSASPGPVRCPQTAGPLCRACGAVAAGAQEGERPRLLRAAPTLPEGPSP